MTVARDPLLEQRGDTSEKSQKAGEVRAQAN